MRKLKYILLALSIIEMGIGFSNAQANMFFYLGAPLGVVFFGLFLITTIFEKEFALSDGQHDSQLAAVPISANAPESKNHSSQTTAYPVPTQTLSS